MGRMRIKQVGRAAWHKQINYERIQNHLQAALVVFRKDCGCGRNNIEAFQLMAARLIGNRRGSMS